ncbi:MAG: hypothetical protein PVF65_02550 [Sphingomonadales bacterium]
MRQTLDNQGLARVAGHILNERHPMNKESAHKLLNARMGAYFSGAEFARKAVDSYFKSHPKHS